MVRTPIKGSETLHAQPTSAALSRHSRGHGALLPPLADLLGREELDVDMTGAGALIHGRRVLVTGAGGSIGSELCRTLITLKPFELLMLDRDESALEAAKITLAPAERQRPERLILADIRDNQRIDRIVRETRPEIIFHAAALKHVPLLERHAEEALLTNVLGTTNVLRAGAEHRIGAVVNISTDKAADPINVLGHSKLLSERITTWFSAQYLETCFVSIRLGNVLTSRGSVLDIFATQLAKGGPLTITDDRATRFLLTPAEAVNLILNTCSVGESGQTIVPHLDTPVRIRDLVDRIVQHNAGTIDVEVLNVGLRPGEKLHEVLVGKQEHVETETHPFFSRVRPDPVDPNDIERAYSMVSADLIDARWLTQLVHQ